MNAPVPALETLDLDTFTERRLRAAAGNIAFWKPYADMFDSPKAYTLVVNRLLERRDFVASMALLVGIIFIIRKLVWGQPLAGWTSLIVSLYLLGGIIINNAIVLLDRIRG